MDGQNLTKFCIHIIIDKIYVGKVKSHFSQICNGVMALDWCQKLVFAQYLDNEYTEFNQILYIHYHWHDLSTISSSNSVLLLNISLFSDSAMAGLWSDPLTILVFAGNKNNHWVSHEFKIWPDQTMLCGVSCSWTSEKNLLLTWELAKNIFMTCWLSGERSLPFGLLV